MDQARIKLTLANSNSLNQSDIFVSNAARQGTPANETVSQCLCEGVQRPKQSHALLVEQGVATPCSVKIATTPERRFAMTNEDCGLRHSFECLGMPGASSASSTYL